MYRWTLLGLALVALSLIVANARWQFLDQEIIGLGIAFTSLIVAVVAVGIADPNPHVFKGRVSVSRTEEPSKNDSYWKVKFKVTNESKQPMANVVVRLRVPRKLVRLGESGYHESTQANTQVLVVDDCEFLGTDTKDNYCGFWRRLDLDKWDNGNIYVTVAGEGFNPKTFIWRPSQKGPVMEKGGKLTLPDS